jgi:hypothetical protein
LTLVRKCRWNWGKEKEGVAGVMCGPEY